MTLSSNVIPPYRDKGFLIAFSLFVFVLLLKTYIKQDFDLPIVENFSDLLLGALHNPYDVARPIVDGYFFFSRVCAGFATLLSVPYAAMILFALGILFHAFTAAFFVRQIFESLVPSSFLRWCIAIYIGFGPGVHVIVGSGICLSYSVVIFLTLLALKPKGYFGIVDLLLVVLFSFSTNFSFVLLPLFIVRYFMYRERAILWGIMSILIASSAMIVPLLSTTSRYASLRSIVGTEEGQGVAAILKGIQKVIYSTPPKALLYFVAYICSFIVAIFFARQKIIISFTKNPVGIALCSMPVLYIMAHAVARPYGFGDLGERHAQILFVPLILALSILFRPLNKGFLWKGMLSVLMIPAIIFQLSLTRLNDGSATHWHDFVVQVRALAPYRKKGFLIAPAVKGRGWGMVNCENTGSGIHCAVFDGNGIAHEYDLGNF